MRRLERQAAVLRRIAPHLQRLCWHQSNLTGSIAVAGLASCLSALQPGQLAELELSDAGPSILGDELGQPCCS